MADVKSFVSPITSPVVYFLEEVLWLFVVVLSSDIVLRSPVIHINISASDSGRLLTPYWGIKPQKYDSDNSSIIAAVICSLMSTLNFVSELAGVLWNK